MRALLFTLMLCFLSCSDEVCEPTAIGVTVCMDKSCEYLEADIVSIGVESFVDSYSAEWNRADLLIRVINELKIHWGKIENSPCPINSLGCQDDKTGLWIQSGVYDDDGKWRRLPPWRTALIHELTHESEWRLEQRTDYEHDDKPDRWQGLLPEFARDLFMRRVYSYLEGELNETDQHH